jgi:hypothetical protein
MAGTPTSHKDKERVGEVPVPHKDPVVPVPVPYEPTVVADSVAYQVARAVRAAITAQGRTLPGPDIPWVGPPVMPCPGLLVSVVTVSDSARNDPTCGAIPEYRLTVQVGRGCAVTFREDGTTDPAAAASVQHTASQDTDALWHVAQALGLSPTVSYFTDGGLLITSMDLNVTEFSLLRAGLT